MQPNTIQQNLHLLLSSPIVMAAAFLYGLSPSTVMPQIFDFQEISTDLSNIFRALMGLYLACALFWIFGMIKPHFWKAATISQILFMGGIGFGRLLSLYLDGMGSILFALGCAGELVLSLFGFYQYFKFSSVKSTS